MALCHARATLRVAADVHHVHVYFLHALGSPRARTYARTVSITHLIMSAIAGSVSLAAPAKARGLGFKSSAPMGSRVAATAVPVRPNKAQRGALKVVAGNTNEGGLFAPIVVIARNIIGVKRFNQIRGKAIALHSQVRARPPANDHFPDNDP